MASSRRRRSIPISPPAPTWRGRVVTTVELRGIADVERGFAQDDADGLYRLLVARGVVADKAVKPAAAFSGVVAPLANVEMVKTPKAGAVLYDVRPGHRVEEGARLATIVFAPGEEDGALDIFAPQSGYVLTRRSTRALRAGDDVLKLVGDRPSLVAKSGALEKLSVAGCEPPPRPSAVAISASSSAMRRSRAPSAAATSAASKRCGMCCGQFESQAVTVNSTTCSGARLVAFAASAFASAPHRPRRRALRPRS